LSEQVTTNEPYSQEDIAIADDPRFLSTNTLTAWFQGLRNFARHRPVSAFWLGVIVLMLLMAVFASFIAPDPPNKPDFQNLQSEPTGEAWFGTDQLGRDLLSRTIYGARVSLFIAGVSVALGTTIGGAFGILGGYLGGTFDLVTQRLLEILMAVPGLLLAIILVLSMGAGAPAVIIAIAITRIPTTSRVLRAEALSVKETQFVDSARSIGASPLRVMFVHIAPQTVASFIVIFTASLGTAILTEASLGFLGLGIAPPTATWGGMLGEAAVTLIPNWWMVFFPGMFITIAVLAFNLLGDGLRDVLDPRTRNIL
jgi:peptide/nickel transport system permease protein